jgi:hypothetical protein
LLCSNLPSGPGISGFQVLRAMFDPWFPKRVPAFGDILVFLNCISHMRQLRSVGENLVSIYINPPVTHYHILDYPKMDEIMEQGYITGKKVIQNWLENQGNKLKSRAGTSKQKIVTEMANARSRASLHLKSRKSNTSLPKMSRVFSEL